MTAPLLAFDPRATAGLPVSLDRLIESRLLIQANSGGGKSRAIRYLLEQTHGRVQHIVLDREGEFSTLRDRFAYALAGPGGETAADVRSAKILARRAMEKGFSLIVDLSEMSLPQQRQYVKAFLDSINHLPRDLWKDCLVVIDEAHLFAPESGKGDGTALEAIALLLSTGRKRGYCAVLATQRIAKLSKDVAAECLNKMIGRTSEEDVKRAAEEIGMPRAEAKSLRALDPGHFWSYGPAIGTDPVLARTGEVTTAPPKRGALREPAPPTPAAIKRILADLADLPQKQAEEDRTVDDLRRDLRETKAQLARAHKSGIERVVEKPVVDETAIARAVAAERKAGASVRSVLSKALEVAIKSLTTLEGTAGYEAKRAQSLLDTVAATESQRGVEVRGMEASRVVGGSQVHSERRRTPSPRVVRATSAEGVSLPKGERLCLIAIASYDEGVERDQLSILSGYKRSTRDAYVQRLGEKGYIEVRGAQIIATAAGVDALGTDYEPLPAGEALQKYWLDRLPEGERKVLAILLDGETHSREEISDLSGYKRSTRDAYIQRLGTRRLIETTSAGVSARETLFS